MVWRHARVADCVIYSMAANANVMLESAHYVRVAEEWLFSMHARRGNGLTDLHVKNSRRSQDVRHEDAVSFRNHRSSTRRRLSDWHRL